MPRNSGGSYSLPPGNPVVTGTIVSSTWANSTLADIAAELTNSLARDGSGSMDSNAAILLANGTASNPSLAFASETNTGLYLAGAGDMRLQVGATNALKLTAASVSAPLGLIVTQDTTDGSAVTGTANGTGYGGDFNAATSTGAGVRGTGIGSGTGATFTGGVTGPGVMGSGGATSGVGVVGAGTGASAGVSGTGGPTAGSGVLGTGGADGAGVWGTGGTGNSIGVVGGGVGTGAGLWGTGGTSAGTPGVLGAGAGASGIGVKGTGSGTGSGITGTGGGSSGIGGLFYGGAGDGTGIQASGIGNGRGGLFANSATSTAPALEASSLSSAPAIQAGAGHIKLAGGNPGKFTAFTNTQTPSNLIKVWGQITTDGAGNVTVVDGFNIGSVAITASHITVTFASAMSTATFATVVSPLTTGVPIPVSAYVNQQTTTTARFAAWKNNSTDRVATVNFTLDAIGVCFMVIGLQ